MAWAELPDSFEPTIAVCIPHNRSTYDSECVETMQDMKWPDDAKQILVRSRHTSIDRMRNNLAEKALECGATHILFLDSDMVCPRDGLLRLWEHAKAGHQIVSAVAWRRAGKLYPCVYHWLEETYEMKAYQHDDWWEHHDLVEVDGVGASCLLIAAEVLMKVPLPWFQFTTLPNGNQMGEDLSFCRKAREMGFKIVVDPGITFGHMIQGAYITHAGVVRVGDMTFVPLSWIDPDTVPKALRK